MAATDQPLSVLRQEFTQALAEFVIWANQQGRGKVAFDAFKDVQGHKLNGFHPRGLATDLILYDTENNYLTKTEDYLWLGEEWERRGGTWGGRFKKPDGNHLSWGE